MKEPMTLGSGPSLTPSPFLKWAGGKAKLVPQLLERFAPRVATHRDLEEQTYLEPFLGGGAFAFALASRFPHLGMLLNDKNEELITAYLAVRDFPEEVIAALGKIPNSTSEVYYRVRAQDELAAATGSAARAARTIFLNKTCFNGLYRVNKRGKFNVPWGRVDDRTFLEPDKIRTASRGLQGCGLRTRDFEEIIDFAKEGDLLYCDPPYLPLTKTANFTAYTSGDTFGEADHRRLAAAVERAAKRGVLSVISSSDTPLARDIYKDFVGTFVQAARSISSKRTTRGKVGELLLHWPSSKERSLFVDMSLAEASAAGVASGAKVASAESTAEPATPKPATHGERYWRSTLCKKVEAFDTAEMVADAYEVGASEPCLCGDLRCKAVVMARPASPVSPTPPAPPALPAPLPHRPRLFGGPR